jgi:predicted DNA-binding transcriptional regulator AlpA
VNHTKPRLLRLADAVERSGISRTRYYELVKAGRLPGIIKIGRSSYVAEAELDAAIAAIIEARGASITPNGAAMREPESVAA